MGRAYDEAIVVDAGANANSGHHFAHLQTIAHLLEPVVDRIRLISGSNFEGEMPEHVTVHRVLSRSGYEAESPGNEPCRSAAYGDISNALFSDLLAEMPTLPSDGHTVVIVPGQTTASLLGISAWLRLAAAGMRAEIVVHLLDNFGVDAIVRGRSNHIRLVEPVAYSAFRAIIENLGPNLPHTRFFSGSVSRMFEFQGLVGRNAPLRPIFLSAMADRKRVRGGEIVLYLGDRKTNKGYYRLPELVEACFSRFPQERFLVQTVFASADEKDDWVYDRLNELSEREDRFSFREDWLDAEEYGSIVASAKAIVLPYDPRSYRHKPSGIAHEALWHDVPLVYPRGTEIEVEMTYWEGRGRAFAGLATDEMLDAIETAIAADSGASEARNRRSAFRRWVRSCREADAFLGEQTL